MAETKIKVNELPSATPTLNDTLLGSNATKEYACKIEDLASLVGGGGSYSEPEIIAPEQTITITENTPLTGVPITLADGKAIDENLWVAGAYKVLISDIPEDAITGSFGNPVHLPDGSYETDSDYSNYFGYYCLAFEETEFNGTGIVRKVDNANEALYTNFVSLHQTYDPETQVVSPMEPLVGSYTISIMLDLPKDVAVPKLLYGTYERDTEEVFYRSFELFLGIDRYRTWYNGYMVDDDIFKKMASGGNVLSAPFDMSSNVVLPASTFTKILGGETTKISNDGAPSDELCFALDGNTTQFRALGLGRDIESQGFEIMGRFFIPDTASYRLVPPEG